LETFTELREFVVNPDFRHQKRKALHRIDWNEIDAPIIELIQDLNQLNTCFTLQCCYGHFVYDHQKDPNNLDPLPVSGIASGITYRIAYVALCIEDCPSGKVMFQDLKKIPDIDKDYIQFGSADWFWERQVNSYALQVEPGRFMNRDSAVVDYQEARHIEKVRTRFFVRLTELVQEKLRSQ
jgi:hypothetical protein